MATSQHCTLVSMALHVIHCSCWEFYTSTKNIRSAMIRGIIIWIFWNFLHLSKFGIGMVETETNLSSFQQPTDPNWFTQYFCRVWRLDWNERNRLIEQLDLRVKQTWNFSLGNQWQRNDPSVAQFERWSWTSTIYYRLFFWRKYIATDD